MAICIPAATLFIAAVTVERKVTKPKNKQANYQAYIQDLSYVLQKVISKDSLTDWKLPNGRTFNMLVGLSIVAFGTTALVALTTYSAFYTAYAFATGLGLASIFYSVLN